MVWGRRPTLFERVKEVCGAFFLMAFFSSILWIPVFGILQAVIDKPWLPNQDMLRDGGSVLLVRKGSRIRGKHDCRIEGLPGVRFAGSHDELIFCLKQADGRTDFVTISREEWG